MIDQMLRETRILTKDRIPGLIGVDGESTDDYRIDRIPHLASIVETSALDPEQQ